MLGNPSEWYAEFTKFYAVEYGDEIKPAEYAVTVRQVEETGNMSVPQNEKNKLGK